MDYEDAIRREFGPCEDDSVEAVVKVLRQAVEAEREACAKIAENEDHGGMIVLCHTIARKIRARGA